MAADSRQLITEQDTSPRHFEEVRLSNLLRSLFSDRPKSDLSVIPGDIRGVEQIAAVAELPRNDEKGNASMI